MNLAPGQAEVLASPAFARARKQADDVVQSRQRLRALLDDVERMIATHPGLRDGVAALDVDIVYAVVEAHLEQQSEGSRAAESSLAVTADARLRLVVAALLYLVDPDDLVPDDGQGGLSDDLALMRWASHMAREELPVPKVV